MIRTIIEFAIKKPVLNHFLLLFLLILSAFAYRDISKEIFPPSKLDAVSITGSYSGASSDLLDKMAVEKIEDDLANLSEAQKITSSVKNGYFNITVTLKKGFNAKDVKDDIKDIVTNSKKNLPSDMDEPVVKEVEHTFPLVTVAIFGDAKKELLLDVATKLKSDISKLEDLSNILINGNSDKEIVIAFDNSKIDAYGLNRPEVINQLSKISSIFPSGTIKDKSGHYYISTVNGEKDIKKLQKIILKIGSKKIYLKDIATVELKYGDVSTISHFNAKRNIAVSINKSEEGDSIELVKRIKDILKEYKEDYKQLEFDTYTDTSIWIKNRLNTVVSNILFGLFLLFLALLFFINRTIAIVVAIGIPTSFMIALAWAEYLGYSMNMLTLLGALIALGMLVDEAIVVGENIYRHMEMGKDRLNAAIDGALEVYPAVLTATATTVFAFLPLLMMTGETGKFMKMLPVMISILLVSSLFEAFFFLPLHAKQIFRVNTARKKTDYIWEKNKALYLWLLERFIRGKYLAILTLVVAIAGSTFLLVKNSKFQLLPDFDTTEIYIPGSVGVGHTIEETAQMVKAIEKKVMENTNMKTEVSSVSSTVGMKLDGQYRPQMEEYFFHIFVNLFERAPSNAFDKYINPHLSPKYDDSKMIRQRAAHSIEKELQELFKQESVRSNFVELNVYAPKAGIVKNDIEIAVSGKEKNIFESLEKIKSSLSNIKGVGNIADDSKTGDKEFKLKVNDYGASLGFNEQGILNELRSMYLEAEYAKMFDESGILKVKLESSDKDKKASLLAIKLQVAGTDRLVNLTDIVEITEIPIISEIIKENGKKIISVTASTRGITSSEVYLKLDKTLKELGQKVNIDIKGEQEENKKVQKEMAEAFVIAVILIFISLIWMFDSIVKSLVILSTIPLSMLGVLAGHMIMGINITMPSIIGMVGLAGVIVNDGIIMMDFIKKSNDPEELKKYALLRLRPILLTSITTVLGLSTLIFFASGQALILQPMAVSLGYGIIWATVLNLFYVPLMYRLIYLRKSF